MSAVSEPMDLGEKVRQRIAEVDASVPGSIGEMMEFKVTGYDPEH